MIMIAHLAAIGLALAPAVPSPSPAELYAPLFDAVELARVFPDSKTFADMTAREAPAQVMADYRAERPKGREALSAFVAAHFAPPNAPNDQTPSLRAHIKSLWSVLSRSPLAVPAHSSALQLTSAYVVPGGRFQEIYYWDSYFTMLGLKADGQQPMVEAMIDNFTNLIERYGHVPNGTRTYYLSRSQPPVYALMLDLSEDRDGAVLRRRLAALKREYAYWMEGSGCAATAGACRNVVRMPNDALLNRYWDAKNTPRDEAYAEDRATLASAPNRPAGLLARDLRAAAESGWDFSSRWFADGRTLASIHTTDIAPVDLNSLLWTMERAIARRCAALSESACAHEFDARSQARRATMQTYLWSPQAQRFGDWDLEAQAPTPAVTAALLFPLFTGWASPKQAARTLNLLRESLLGPGGVRTSLVRTGQQWDAPNGWAPLQ